MRRSSTGVRSTPLQSSQSPFLLKTRTLGDPSISISAFVPLTPLSPSRRWSSQSMAPLAIFRISLVLLSLCLLLGDVSSTSANATSKSNLDRHYSFPLVVKAAAPSNETIEGLEGQKDDFKGAAGKANRLWLRTSRVNVLAEVEIGTPPQKHLMVIDTASELSWLHCARGRHPTEKPGADVLIFQPSKSTSFREVPCASTICKKDAGQLPIPSTCDAKTSKCSFACSYADGTDVQGSLSIDKLSLQGQSKQRRYFVFGCASTALRNTPGLLGLNKGVLSLVSQLQGGPSKAMFSMCVASGGAQGVLILGDGLPPEVRIRLRYTPMETVHTKGWSPPYFDKEAYSIRMEGIKVGNALLPIPKSVFEPDHTGAGQTMIDSATHFTLLLGDAYTPLRQEFLRQNSHVLGSPLSDNFVYEGALDLCYSRPAGAPSPLELELTPVTLLLDSFDLVLEGPRLLFEVPGKNEKRIFCLAFGNSDLVAVEANIIGNHHQQDLWVQYDLHNSRLGFARGRCSGSAAVHS